MKKLLVAGLVVPLLMNPVSAMAQDYDRPTMSESASSLFSDDTVDITVNSITVSKSDKSLVTLKYTAKNKTDCNVQLAPVVFMTNEIETVQSRTHSNLDDAVSIPAKSTKPVTITFEMAEDVDDSELQADLQFKVIKSEDQSYTTAIKTWNAPDKSPVNTTGPAEESKDSEFSFLRESDYLCMAHPGTVEAGIKAISIDTDKNVIEFKTDLYNDSASSVTVTVSSVSINNKNYKTSFSQTLKARESASAVISVSTKNTDLQKVNSIETCSFTFNVKDSSGKKASDTASIKEITWSTPSAPQLTGSEIIAQVIVNRDERMVHEQENMTVKFLGATLSRISNSQYLLAIELDTANLGKAPLTLAVTDLSVGNTPLSGIYYPTIQSKGKSSEYLMAYMSASQAAAVKDSDSASFKISGVNTDTSESFVTRAITFALGNTSFATHPDIDGQIAKIQNLYDGAVKDYAKLSEKVDTLKKAQKEAEKTLTAKNKEVEQTEKSLKTAKEALEKAVKAINTENKAKVEDLTKKKEKLSEEIEDLTKKAENAKELLDKAKTEQAEIETSIEAIHTIMESKDKEELDEDAANRLLAQANEKAKEISEKIAKVSVTANMDLSPYEKAVTDAEYKIAGATAVFNKENELLPALKEDYEKYRENFIKQGYIASQDPNAAVLFNNYTKTAELMDDAIEVMLAYLDIQNIGYAPEYSTPPELTDKPGSEGNTGEKPDKDPEGSDKPDTTTPGTTTPGTQTPGSNVPGTGGSSENTDGTGGPAPTDPGKTPDDELPPEGSDSQKPGTTPSGTPSSPGSSTPSEPAGPGSTPSDGTISSGKPETNPGSGNQNSGDQPGSDPAGSDKPSLASLTENTLSSLSEVLTSLTGNDPTEQKAPSTVKPGETLQNPSPTDPEHVIYKANEAIRNHEDAAKALCTYSKNLEDLYCHVNTRLQKYVKVLFEMRDARNRIAEGKSELSKAQSALTKAQLEKVEAQKELDQLLVDQKENNLTIKTLENRKKTIEELKCELSALDKKLQNAKDETTKKQTALEEANKKLEDSKKALEDVEKEIKDTSVEIKLEDLLDKDYKTDNKDLATLIDLYKKAEEALEKSTKELEKLKETQSADKLALENAEKEMAIALAKRDAYSKLLAAAKAGKTEQETAIKNLQANQKPPVNTNTGNTPTNTVTNTNTVTKPSDKDNTTTSNKNDNTTTSNKNNNTTTANNNTGGGTSAATHAANTGAGSLMGAWYGMFGLTSATGSGFFGFKLKKWKKK